MELADEKAVLEQVHADVDAVAGLIKENKKLSGVLHEIRGRQWACCSREADS